VQRGAVGPAWHLGFDLDLFLANLRAVNPAAAVIRASARTGDGVDAWCQWLREQIKQRCKR